MKSSVSMRQQSGFSLTEVIVALGIASLLTVSVIAVMNDMSQQQQGAQLRQTMVDLKQRALMAIQNPRSWSVTVLMNQAEFSCLDKSTPLACDGSDSAIALYKTQMGAAGTIAVVAGDINDAQDLIVPKITELGTGNGAGNNEGFTIKGERCNTFPSANCFIQAQAIWRANCITYPCDGNNAQDSIDLIFFVATKDNVPAGKVAGMRGLQTTPFNTNDHSLFSFNRMTSEVLTSDIYNNIYGPNPTSYFTGMDQVYFNPKGSSSLTNANANTQVCLAKGMFYYDVLMLVDQSVPPSTYYPDADGCFPYNALAGPRGNSASTSTTIAPTTTTICANLNLTPASAALSTTGTSCNTSSVMACGTPPFSVNSLTNPLDPAWNVSIAGNLLDIQGAPVGANTIGVIDSLSVTGSFAVTCTLAATTTLPPTTTTIPCPLAIAPTSDYDTATNGTGCDLSSLPSMANISCGTAPYTISAYTNSGNAYWNAYISGSTLVVSNVPNGAQTITVRDAAATTVNFTFTCTPMTTTTVAPTTTTTACVANVGQICGWTYIWSLNGTTNGYHCSNQTAEWCTYSWMTHYSPNGCTVGTTCLAMTDNGTDQGFALPNMGACNTQCHNQNLCRRVRCRDYVWTPDQPQYYQCDGSCASTPVTTTTTTTVPPTCTLEHTTGSVFNTANINTTDAASSSIRERIQSTLPNTNIWDISTRNGVPVATVLIGTTNAAGSFTWYVCGGGGMDCAVGNYRRAYMLAPTAASIPLCTTAQLRENITAVTGTTVAPPSCSATHNNGMGSGDTTATYTVTVAQSAGQSQTVNGPGYPNTNIWSYGTNNGVAFGPPYPYFVGATDATGNYTWAPCPGTCPTGTFMRYFELKAAATDTALCTTNQFTTIISATTTTSTSTTSTSTTSTTTAATTTTTTIPPCVAPNRISATDGLCHTPSVSSFANFGAGNICADASSWVNQTATWFGSNAVGCLNYQLTLKAGPRNGETKFCNTSSPVDMELLSTKPWWSFNFATDTWTSLEWTRNSNWVPGFYQTTICDAVGGICVTGPSFTIDSDGTAQNPGHNYDCMSP